MEDVSYSLRFWLQMTHIFKIFLYVLAELLVWCVMADSSLLNMSRTSYHAIPWSPLTDMLHQSGDVHVSPVVDPTNFDVHMRFSTSWNEDILR